MRNITEEEDKKDNGKDTTMPVKKIFKFQDVLQTLVMFALEQEKLPEESRQSNHVYYKVVGTSVYLRIFPIVVYIRSRP